MKDAIYIGLSIWLVPAIIYGIRLVLWLRCTVVVDAVLSSIDSSSNDQYDDIIKGTTYLPIYKYTYNNVEYEVKSQLPLWNGRGCKKVTYPNGVSVKMAPIGEHVKLHINPNKPKQFIKFDALLLYKASFFIVGGLIAISIGMVK